MYIKVSIKKYYRNMIREFKAAFNYKLNEQITECDFIWSLTLLKPLGFPSKTQECETDGIPKGSSDLRVYIYLKKKKDQFV